MCANGVSSHAQPIPSDDTRATHTYIIIKEKSRDNPDSSPKGDNEKNAENFYIFNIPCYNTKDNTFSFISYDSNNNRPDMKGAYNLTPISARKRRASDPMSEWYTGQRAAAYEQ